MNIHVFSGKFQEHQEDDEQYDGDNRPHFCPRRKFVCLDFRYVFVGDLLSVTRIQEFGRKS
jgi:hypothetical protein